ncbi:MAG TPA: hypothetical protein VGM30_05730 [Puia sp.]|jgi:hypothetical protein
MSPAHAFYTDKITSCTGRITSIRQRRNGISLLRLFAFAALAFLIYRLFVSFSYPVLAGALIAAAIFMILVRIYFRLKDEQALWEKLLFVNNNEQALLNYRPNGFPDGGTLLDSDSYLDDLDIFGPASVFHVLNRTTTSHGATALATLLRRSLLSPTDIADQQQAVRILSQQPELRQLLTAKGLLSGEKEGNLHTLQNWLTTASRLYRRKGLRIAAAVLIVWNLLSILFYLDTNNYVPLLLGVLLSWALTGSFSGYISQQHVMISKRQAILDQYAAILSAFNTVDAQGSRRLEELRSRTGQASAAIRRLSQLTGFFDQRMNMLVNIFLNSFLLYDLQCMIALEKWKETNAANFPDWIDAVGSIECLNSLATFAFNNPDYHYPQPVASASQTSASNPSTQAPDAMHPSAGGLFLSTTQIAHPLIPAAERITNDFTIGQPDRLILVTGSNMSGKTTFLRTIGVNLLLAQCGAPVCATGFSFTPMQILTSLRVSDSLQEHTSYFMAELKKLQKIIHRLRTGEPSLVLIDEILRGTNSEDKTYGSEQFIRQLIQYQCLSLFATHDLSLGQLEQEMPGVIANYCFESTIEAGNLHFDYRLQRGLARNRNASFLMKKMEII